MWFSFRKNCTYWKAHVRGPKESCLLCLELHSGQEHLNELSWLVRCSGKLYIFLRMFELNSTVIWPALFCRIFSSFPLWWSPQWDISCKIKSNRGSNYFLLYSKLGIYSSSRSQQSFRGLLNKISWLIDGKVKFSVQFFRIFLLKFNRNSTDIWPALFWIDFLSLPVVKVNLPIGIYLAK